MLALYFVIVRVIMFVMSQYNVGVVHKTVKLRAHITSLGSNSSKSIV